MTRSIDLGERFMPLEEPNPAYAHLVAEHGDEAAHQMAVTAIQGAQRDPSQPPTGFWDDGGSFDLAHPDLAGVRQKMGEYFRRMVGGTVLLLNYGTLKEAQTMQELVESHANGKTTDYLGISDIPLPANLRPREVPGFGDVVRVDKRQRFVARATLVQAHLLNALSQLPGNAFHIIGNDLDTSAVPAGRLAVLDEIRRIALPGGAIATIASQANTWNDLVVEPNMPMALVRTADGEFLRIAIRLMSKPAQSTRA